MPPVKPIFGTPLNRAHWAAKDLVASYLFNEGSGRTVYDSSGNGNHGTMIGFGAEDTPTRGWVPGPHGGALAFALGNYVDCGNSDVFNITGSNRKTILADIKISSFLKYAMVLSKWNSNAVGAGWQFNFNTDGTNPNKQQFWARNAASSNWNSIENVANAYIATQYNLACVINGGAISLYRNSNTLSCSGTGSAFDASNTSPVRIGIRGDSTGAQLQGIISYLHFYDRALSPSEIAYLNAFPYCMYEQEESIYSKPFNQNFYRRLLAGGY